MDDIKLGFVVAEFNREITYQMEIVGKEHATFLGATVERIVYVPGVFDMPIMIKKLGEKDGIDAIVAIGAVIEGDTEHDEVVAQHAARKIMDLSLEMNKPVTLGISGPGMTRLGAYERVDYAKRAVESAVKLVKRLRDLD